jgi:hypothetical protein
MKRLTLILFISLFIIMSVAALNYSPGRSAVQSGKQLSAQCSEPGRCSANISSSRSDCSKPCCA